MPVLQGLPLPPAAGEVVGEVLATGSILVAVSGVEGLDEVAAWPVNGVVLERRRPGVGVVSVGVGARAG